MAAPRQFEIQYRGQTHGPYEADQVLGLLDSGRVSRFALVRDVASSQWRSLGDLVAAIRFGQAVPEQTQVDVSAPIQPPPLPPDPEPFQTPEDSSGSLIRIPDLPPLPVTYLAADPPRGLGHWLRGIIKHLPWPVKLVVAMGFIGMAVFGTAGAGFVSAATGGIPVFLSLLFLGFAFMLVGIITTIQAIFRDPKSGAYLGVVMGMIARDIAVRRASDALQKAMAAKPAAPDKQPMPPDEADLRQRLLAMDPFDFERHVMSFFSDAGMVAWVTKKSNDAGVDGFSRHPKGLVVVQCKRNAASNPVGRPVVQQLKGVVEENQAWCGIIVTTSSFTLEAQASGGKSERIVLVDMDALVEWHKTGLSLD
ncbi:MAG: restriction endonuclease [Candidatus Methylacidiphilales bacterium]|nr:restriction endonuclease [Candidatus Methylacidiphilales bacterium]